MKNKILSITLSLLMVISMMPMLGGAAYAADSTEIQNVQLASDGTLTWDAFEGAAQYNFNISNFNELVEGTSCNLSEILEDHGKTSGNYDIELYAIDDDYLQISTTHYLTYSYTAKNPQLATPANFKWDGTTVSWDPVDNATSYSVYVYEDSFSSYPLGWPEVNENKIDISSYLLDGTRSYGISVKAKAEGYPDSEQGKSVFQSITKELPSLTGVTIAGSNISWDEFSGAVGYELAMSTFSNNIYATSANLNDILKSYGKPSGEYTIELSAIDSSNKHISRTWTGTYSYTALEPLSKPTNLVWSDKTITWDSVANATSYQVSLFEGSYSSVARATITTTETSFEIPTKYLDVGTKNYGVWIKALSDEYPSSENVESEFHPITYIKPSIQNAKINDGVLSWDSFPGAKDYIVEISADDIGITYTDATSFNVDSMLKTYSKPSGDYSITLSARDSEGNSISTTTHINYHYLVKYDITAKSADANGSVTGSGTYDEGDTVTIQAYPNTGYVFGWWTDKWGSIITGADKVYSFVIGPESSPEYTAWFEKCTHEQTETRVENLVPATTSADGSCDIVTYCKDCDEELARESATAIPRIDSVKLSTTSYTYSGKAKSPSVTVKDADGNILQKGTDYTVSVPSGRTKVGKYTYTVDFIGKYDGSKSVSFTIKPATPVKKSLTSGSRKLTLALSTKPSSKGASYYKIAYKRKGTSTWRYTTTSASSKTIKSLKKGKQYYVKVYAYKTVGGTKYSSAWTKTYLSKKIK